jgi:hypothetical protein
LMNGDSTENESLSSISSVSNMTTRSRIKENLEVSTPTQCFMHHGVKFCNGAPQRVKDAKTKFFSKRAIEENNPSM